ncbi:Protein of unknown function [Anaerovirgula multivorans]|uniref:DUF2848 domain-containing protein n=1 Tax=Anaerovirgula multivorans TaxID=312168 RepID=A0A239L9W2_9FIRM|nr:DUF2848 family protein [Anaerovirgula multivorans]SNT27241.1 Protein of unknown function [Anaerovirgula multivorans]
MGMINFTLKNLSGDENLTVNYDELLVIGYAGRNIEKTMEHIKELEEQLGVAPPKKIPTIFECSHELLTQEDIIKFVGKETSGEVEYIIVLANGSAYIGIGSDHTDRKLESISVPKAKQVCPKPIGKELWNYDDIKDHWDQIKLVSYQTIDGKEILYQDGSLADILPVEKILSELKDRIGAIQNSIIFSGTVPLLNGFAYGDNFRCMIIDQVLDRTLSFNYNIEIISEEER